MSPRYAANTDVGSDRSRAEIEHTLRRYGATAFTYGWSEGQAHVVFEMAARRIIFRLPVPDRTSDEFTLSPTGRRKRSPAAADAAYEQAVRQRWRALALVIKAKLEAVDAKISTVEEEFLAYLALPNGSTVSEWLGPQLEEVYASHQMPALLPGSTR